MNRVSHEGDLIVVGGGVLGTFHAYHAAKRGLRVLLFESNPRPRNATVRNFGQIVPSGSCSHWQRWGRESLEIYKSIQDKCDISAQQNGSIYIASNADELGLLEELHAINQENAYESELWTIKQCLSRYPHLKRDYCQGGLFFPDELSVNPRLMIHRVHDYLSNQVSFHYNSPIQQLATSANRVIAETANGTTYSAETAIVCSGTDFQSLYPDLYENSDLQLVKLQMLRLNPQPQIKLPGNILTGLSIRRYESFSECPSWSSIKAAEPDDCFWKAWGVHLLFKQEVDGSIIVGDSHEYASVKNRDAIGFDLRDDINRYFIDEGKKILDLPHWDVESSWAGLYCQTKHESGIFQKTIDGRIHIVTGIGGKGMTSSPGFSKHHIAELYHD